MGLSSGVENVTTLHTLKFYISASDQASEQTYWTKKHSTRCGFARSEALLTHGNLGGEALWASNRRIKLRRFGKLLSAPRTEVLRWNARGTTFRACFNEHTF